MGGSNAQQSSNWREQQAEKERALKQRKEQESAEKNAKVWKLDVASVV
jgi:hypothetical protein